MKESLRLAKVGPHWVKESLRQWLVFFYKEEGWRDKCKKSVWGQGRDYQGGREYLQAEPAAHPWAVGLRFASSTATHQSSIT